ncbi:MAG TPA: hypothetical protein VG984_02915 [Candidatus Paceibacterota bacterium]|nr:hypothetical protein [Candidatus Paceibacterota bacterium]
MSALFGKGIPKDSTVLIVDIQNASVGCALVRLSGGGPPKLFAETRAPLPLLHSVSAHALLKESDKALRHALLQASTTAARMRNHTKLSHMGTVGAAHVFVSPPWVTAQDKNGTLTWDTEPTMQKTALHAIHDTFGDIKTSFHTTGAALTHTTNLLFEQTPDILLCSIGGEVSELTLLQSGQRAAYATMPVGHHFVLRTLTTHAGVSPHEAHSMLRLARTTHTETPGEEALFAAAQHFAKIFTQVAGDMLEDSQVQGILVVGMEPVGEWAAQNLSMSDLGGLFSADTVVQALHTHHVAPYLAAHASHPDLLFMAQALYIDSKNRVIH